MKTIQRAVLTIDATEATAGRLASRVAFILMGKNKVEYAPYLDAGDLVLLTNPDKLRFSGKKTVNKRYYQASGYPGGLKSARLGDLIATRPEFLFRGMVYRMLPKNKLRDRMIKRLSFAATDESLKNTSTK